MDRTHKTLLAAGLLLLAAVLLIQGIVSGAPTLVWVKAVNVCMECIGLG